MKPDGENLILNFVDKRDARCHSANKINKKIYFLKVRKKNMGKQEILINQKKPTRQGIHTF